MMEDPQGTQQLRVSVATYNQVLFPHPEDGRTMLALERKATVLRDGRVTVESQPFGGGIRILDPAPLQRIIGTIQFDSGRSQQERDFRILIPASKWGLVKEFLLHHLASNEGNGIDLESSPNRELTEEFLETINVKLNPVQYTVQPMGFVIENSPVGSKNDHARGRLTVRLYRIFKVEITDPNLCRVIFGASQHYSDEDLAEIALQDSKHGGPGRANSILTLPLNAVRNAYLALPPTERYKKIVIESHGLDESVAAVLEEIDVPQYQRV